MLYFSLLLLLPLLPLAITLAPPLVLPMLLPLVLLLVLPLVLLKSIFFFRYLFHTLCLSFLLHLTGYLFYSPLYLNIVSDCLVLSNL